MVEPFNPNRTSRHRAYVYLAGPIAGCNQDEAKTWRDEIMFQLPPNIVGISPLRSEPADSDGVYKLTYDDVLYGSAGAISAKNMMDVRTCDLLLAYLPKELNDRRPSYGTIWEIASACMLSKPVIIWTDDDYVRGHPLLKFHVPWFVSNQREAVAVITGLFGDYVKS